ncbi:hypothetical protein ABZ714_16280 [Streptomyces sp. NPDC006798]|uniref:hypothetical protein n=1 Tax=Streptomyces sp. NPDC006798 TaxID=3155462 RepID=UPI0033E0FF21
MRTDNNTPDWTPQIGGNARDATRDKVGRVMDRTYGRYWLRPIGGGIEWDVPAADLRPVTTAELLAEAVAEANERSSKGDLG